MYKGVCVFEEFLRKLESSLEKAMKSQMLDAGMEF